MIEFVKVQGRSGTLDWNPRGYWVLRVGDWWGTESIPDDTPVTDGMYDEKAVEDAKRRLFRRAKAVIRRYF